ncbi:MAG: hypothetical protein J6J24_04685 [Clostridia bacterium]|nr:hypothetical protein [Clostridia bacterium]
MNKREIEELFEIDNMFKKICRDSILQGKSAKFDDNFYKLLSFKFGSLTVGERIENEETAGNCYFYALLLCRAIPRSSLKHGYLHNLEKTVNNEKIKFPHAWVETGDFVYDATAKQAFVKKDYYQSFGAEVNRSYLYENICNPYFLFKLGVMAVKERPMLAQELMEYDGFKKIDGDFKRECLRAVIDVKSTEILNINLEDEKLEKEKFSS